ncbi:uncharacterized protein LOC131689553 [Topomyia yanbarensis]|uniref:uncharacterized protein LOC131689553 n=1 Tax=Topomyia yanbarensis TaxID=2498891 RepID=UPI00273C479B|nr:uncharacterized protein LOC131689553 [Topomyia yanbarensis]
MTVAVSLSEEKPPFGGTIPGPEPNPKCACSCDNKNSYLRSKTGMLTIAQIVFGIVALALIRSPNYFIVGYGLLILAFNASLVSAAIFWDGFSEGKLRRLFVLEAKVWNTAVLYYTGIVGLLYYFSSFGMIAVYIWAWSPETNIVAGVFGLLACFAHVYNWFLQYKTRVNAGRVREAMSQAGMEQQP